MDTHKPSHQPTQKLSPLEAMFNIKKPEKFTPGCVGSIVGIKAGTARYIEHEGHLHDAVNPADLCYGIVVDNTSVPNRVKVIMAGSNVTWIKPDDLVLPNTLNSQECHKQFGDVFNQITSHPVLDEVCKFGELPEFDGSQTWYTTEGSANMTTYKGVHLDDSTDVIKLCEVDTGYIKTIVVLWNNYVLNYSRKIH